MKTCVMTVCCALCLLAIAARAEDKKPTGDVSKQLGKKITAEFENTPLGEFADFVKMLIGAEVEVSKSVGDKQVSLHVKDTLVSEVLKEATKQTRTITRVKEGKVLIATVNEFAAIDAGKAKFVAWTRAEEPVAVSGAKDTDKDAESKKKSSR